MNLYHNFLHWPKLLVWPESNNKSCLGYSSVHKHLLICSGEFCFLASHIQWYALNRLSNNSIFYTSIVPLSNNGNVVWFQECSKDINVQCAKALIAVNLRDQLCRIGCRNSRSILMKYQSNIGDDLMMYCVSAYWHTALNNLKEIFIYCNSFQDPIVKTA